MQRVMAEAMEDGAFGVSMALIYPPSAYTDTAEIIEIAKVVGQYGGLYITHLRSEADDFLAALDEAMDDWPSPPGCRLRSIISRLQASATGPR